jgi:hypothetical protein
MTNELLIQQIADCYYQAFENEQYRFMYLKSFVKLSERAAGEAHNRIVKMFFRWKNYCIEHNLNL